MFPKVTFARLAAHSTTRTPNVVSRSIRRFKNIITGRFASSPSVDVKQPLVQKTACELETAICELQTRLGMLEEQISFEVENRADLKDWYELLCRQYRPNKERLDSSKALLDDCSHKRNLLLKNLEEVCKEEKLSQEALKKLEKARKDQRNQEAYEKVEKARREVQLTQERVKKLENVCKEMQFIQETLNKVKDGHIGNLSSSNTSVNSSSTSATSSSAYAKSNTGVKTGGSTDTMCSSTASAMSSNATLKASL
ncbi:hypothetical protein GGI07_005919 [Coemansia sp. Benny D115]|nr:hypothetical protein GGI07_005919 [Coemansia sp. Benny D115]